MTPQRVGANEHDAPSVGYLHDDPGFADILGVAQTKAGIPLEFVEKDYWVTHVLWWLQREKFGVSFKGGTSLSKCFGLIQRFSEDIYVHLVAPTTMAVPVVQSWAPSDSVHAADRFAYFEWLTGELRRIPGLTAVRHDVSRHAPRHINAIYFLEYPSRFEDTAVPLQTFVQLEIAPDTIYATVSQPAISLVHDALSPSQLAGYINNRPATLSCAHPLATLLGKLDAICNQHARASDPSRYVRHFEDVHHIISAIPSVPELPDRMTVQDLAARMYADKQIRRRYDAQDPAFTLPDAADRAALEVAHAELRGWHWGPRVSLMDACATIRGWLRRENLFSKT